MRKKLSRRRFLRAAGVAASAAVIVPRLFDLEQVAHAAPLTRKDVAGLSAASPVIASYGNAVNAMKALPGSNPLSW